MYTPNHDAVMWLVFFGIILLKFYLQEQKLMFENYKIKSCLGRFEELQNNAFFFFSLSGTYLCSYKNISFLSLNFHRSSRARASQLIASFPPPPSLSCVTGLSFTVLPSRFLKPPFSSLRMGKRFQLLDACIPNESRIDFWFWNGIFINQRYLQNVTSDYYFCLDEFSQIQF